MAPGFATNYIEHPEVVAQRIVRFAETVGRENIIAGVDCDSLHSPQCCRSTRRSPGQNLPHSPKERRSLQSNCGNQTSCVGGMMRSPSIE